jgi:hypothetical protein
MAPTRDSSEAMMSGNSDTNTKVAEPATTVAQFWTDWFSQSNEQATAFLDAIRPLGDSQSMQRRGLDAVSQSLDGFMRTPAFLEAMQRNLKMVTDLKTLQDQFTHDAARQAGLPTAADITGLFERLNSVEQEILSRLNVIETRLKTIESRLS